MGGLDRLADALEHIRARGMDRVRGCLDRPDRVSDGRADVLVPRLPLERLAVALLG